MRKKKNNENEYKSVRGQCDSLMLLWTMASKWYKKAIKGSH